MENNKALEILINVAKLAQKGGLLSLEDAVVVKQAIDVFLKPQETPQNTPGDMKPKEVSNPPKGTGKAPKLD